LPVEPVDAFVDSTKRKTFLMMIRVGIVAQISQRRCGKRAEGGGGREWPDGLMMRGGGDGEDYTKVSLKEQ
jgi:hypothetical protein